MVNAIQPSPAVSPLGAPLPDRMIPKAVLKCRPNSQPFPERTLMLDKPVQIGRSVARVKASKTNGVFDCRVLSRNHALLWYENGKFYLKDVKSSNGTFVNNQRLSKNGEESIPRELASGDILQFGVNVQTDTKKLTHGCIVAVVHLFLPDGSEAKACPSLALSSKESTMTPLEIYQLQSLLQEAGYREQLVQDKLLVLQELLVTLEKSVAKSWTKMLDEETMLKRFEILEAKLSLYSKTYEDHEIKEELILLREEKAFFEAECKERLQNVLNDKIHAVSKYCEMGRTCNQASTEAERMRKIAEACKLKEKQLVTRLSKQAEEIDELTRQLRLAETNLQSTTKCQENHHNNEASENAQLQIQIECLKAERDITLEQLAAFKSKYENLKNSVAVQAISECSNEELAAQEAEVSHSYESLKESIGLLENWLTMLRRDVCHTKIAGSRVTIEVPKIETEEQKFKSLKETLEGYKVEHKMASESNSMVKTSLLKQIEHFKKDLITLSENNTTNFEDHTNTIVRQKKKNIKEDIKDIENNEMIIPLEKQESPVDTTLINFDTVCLNGKISPNSDPFKDISSYIQLKISTLQADVEACEKKQEEAPNEKKDIEGDLAHYQASWEKAKQQLAETKATGKENEALLKCQNYHVEGLTEIKALLDNSMDIVHSHLYSLSKRISREKEQVVSARNDIMELNGKLLQADTLAHEMAREADTLKTELQQVREESVHANLMHEEMTKKFQEQNDELTALREKLEAREELELEQARPKTPEIEDETHATESCDVLQCTNDSQSSTDALSQQLSSLMEEHEKLKTQLSSQDEDLSDLALQNQIVVPTWLMLIALFIAICWSGISS